MLIDVSFLRSVKAKIANRNTYVNLRKRAMPASCAKKAKSTSWLTATSCTSSSTYSAPFGIVISRIPLSNRGYAAFGA